MKEKRNKMQINAKRKNAKRESEKHAFWTRMSFTNAEMFELENFEK